MQSIRTRCQQSVYYAVLLGSMLLQVNAANAVQAIRWIPDPQLNQMRHGAREVWHDKLWGVDFLTGKTWYYDGTQFVDAGRMPGAQRPMVTRFTDYGVFMMGPSGTGSDQKAEIVWSPDGIQDYKSVLSIVSLNKGVPFAAGQDHSLVDLGQGRMLYFEYSEDARVYYSDDQGQDWRLVLQPSAGSIRHFHGAYYDEDYGKLYVMSGDSDSQSSIMVCDDLFGVDGLINNPDRWKQLWGMTNTSRATLDASYFLNPDGVIRSQRTRAVDMQIDGDYIYWGEDSGYPEGQSLYRVNRVTQDVNEVGLGDIKGGPWRTYLTPEGDFQFFTASLHFNGQVLVGNDDYAHVYQLNDARDNYFEIARFPSKQNAVSGASAYGYVEAFGRTWINGYNITEKNLDLVGRFTEVTLGDYDGDGILTAADMDSLSAQLRPGTKLPIYDLDLSGVVDEVDREYWVTDLAHIAFGDVDFNGRFDSNDLVIVFQQGQYEDYAAYNSGWAQGDWNGDTEFTSADLVYVLQRTAYDNGATAGRAVPEPATDCGLLSIAMELVVMQRARAASRTRLEPI